MREVCFIVLMGRSVFVFGYLRERFPSWGVTVMVFNPEVFQISDVDVARYDEDGAVCLRSAIPMTWIARLRAAIDADISSPGPMKRNTSRRGEAGLSFLDFQLWQRHD